MQVGEDNNNIPIQDIKPNTPAPSKKGSQAAVPERGKYSIDITDKYTGSVEKNTSRELDFTVYKKQVPSLSSPQKTTKTEKTEKFNTTPASPSYFTETRLTTEEHDEKFSHFARRSLSEFNWSSTYNLANYVSISGSFSKILNNLNYRKDDNVIFGAINIDYNKENGPGRINAGIGLSNISILDVNTEYSRRIIEGSAPMPTEKWLFNAHVGYSRKIFEGKALDMRSGIQVNYDGKNTIGEVFIEAEAVKPMLKMKFKRNKKDGKKEEINLGAIPYLKVYQPIISTFPNRRTRIEFGAKIKI